MEEKIFNFINNEDFHAEDELGNSCIAVETLNTFFKLMFSTDLSLSNRTELETFFNLKK